MLRRKGDAPSRGVDEIGAGDFVKIGSQWKEVAHNNGQGQPGFPRAPWTITTVDGAQHGMFGINRYAKAEDIVDD